MNYQAFRTFDNKLAIINFPPQLQLPFSMEGDLDDIKDVGGLFEPIKEVVRSYITMYVRLCS